jgi:hypothetical protein
MPEVNPRSFTTTTPTLDNDGLPSISEANAEVWFRLDAIRKLFQLQLGPFSAEPPVSGGDIYRLGSDPTGKVWITDADGARMLLIDPSSISGGGGGTSTAGGVPVEIDLGNGAVASIFGSSTGVTWSVSQGVGTLTLPATARLDSLTVRGTNTSASYTGGSFQNAFKIRIVNTGSASNVSVAKLLGRHFEVGSLVNASNISPSNPLQFDNYSVPRVIDELGNSTVGYVFDRIGSRFNEWFIVT